jgi:toxin secretion/phage lysis holin
MIVSSLLHVAKDDYFILFVLIVLFDFITGYLKSVVNKVTSSQIGTKGVIKHTSTIGFYFFVVFLGYYFNNVSLTYLILTMVVLTYLTSILENLGVMGVYVPQFLKNKVESEKKKYEKMLNESEEKK